MAAPKGHAKYGGRSKGTPNKSTANAREAIALFVEGNIEKLQEWLDDIAETEGSRAAWECFMDTVEYHIPKLQRTELTGENGQRLEIKVVRYSDSPPT
jgi:hypothetical protein